MLLTPRRNDRLAVVRRLLTPDRSWSGSRFGKVPVYRKGPTPPKGRVTALAR